MMRQNLNARRPRPLTRLAAFRQSGRPETVCAIEKHLAVHDVATELCGDDHGEDIARLDRIPDVGLRPERPRARIDSVLFDAVVYLSARRSAAIDYLRVLRGESVENDTSNGDFHCAI